MGYRNTSNYFKRYCATPSRLPDRWSSLQTKMDLRKQSPVIRVHIHLHVFEVKDDQIEAGSPDETTETEAPFYGKKIPPCS